jgi:Tfp pilus assembly protein PilF
MMTRHLPLLLSSVVLAVAAGCAQPPAAAPVGLLDVTSRPAERALLAGIRTYEDGQYAESEKQLNAALQAGLVSPKDIAAAQKYLAFIYCTSNRTPLCETAFRAARQADPVFALSRSEQGHQVWGPVYKRVLP